MSHEMLMWIGIGIWLLFGIMAAVGYYAGKSSGSVSLPSGSTTVLYGGS